MNGFRQQVKSVDEGAVLLVKGVANVERRAVKLQMTTDTCCCSPPAAMTLTLFIMVISDKPVLKTR